MTLKRVCKSNKYSVVLWVQNHFGLIEFLGGHLDISQKANVKSQKWSFWNCPKLFGPAPTGAMLRKYLCKKNLEHKFINALGYE